MKSTVTQSNINRKTSVCVNPPKDSISVAQAGASIKTKKRLYESRHYGIIPQQITRKLGTRIVDPIRFQATILQKEVTTNV